ncbi:uncharacterized protein N7459_001799 [Penicillium hispanicum]|uniref:uncharacterized protein n=1 Tax=Penicillium hispanicum TaxID=1080232 RepID=UPI002540AA4C|nr:uncharacterized protein N7459_001799 [Penicillium hispanicum]KAJ5595591.1 hypothetical protein N7459_001799 [Penicillium hispanicum]
MGTALDTVSQPLNTRRPAAPTLPSFELPPPPFGLPGAAAPKYTAQANHPPVSHPPANVSVGNLLTPPATNQSSETATASQALAPSSGISSDLPPAYWTGTGTGITPYGTGAGAASAAQTWAPAVNSAYTGRSSFSQPGVGGRSSATSPPTTDGLPQPFEAPSLASFPQALPAPPSSLPPHASQPAMALYPSGPAAAPAPLPSNDPYNSKPHSIYGASPHLTSSHQAGFSHVYGAPPSIGAAGLGIQPSARMHPQSPSGQPPFGFHRQPWPSYSLPAMNGPVMTNVHNPNSPMSVMGGMPSALLPGFNSGHVANTQHLYGGHPPPHGLAPPAADRPFKCDQCPQSFNRNHDLKRHKRIHLAVKPFPCAHCEKSFSRKDALKRHILVKGCGKDGDSDTTSTQMGLDGTVKGEGRSEDGSPDLHGRS